MPDAETEYNLQKAQGVNFMAFVGFWMIPLGLMFYAVDKVFSLFGFDLTGWLANPVNQGRILDGIEGVVTFACGVWNFAEPYVMPVWEALNNFFN